MTNVHPSTFDPSNMLQLGTLRGGAQIVASQTTAGWGLTVQNAGHASAIQPHPAQIEVIDEQGAIQTFRAGYDSVDQIDAALRAMATIRLPNGAQIAIEDTWHCDGECLRLSRDIAVRGDAPGGFLSAITFEIERPATIPDVDLFAPGMLYGRCEHITDVAIGGSANYAAGIRQIRIREDRLPAPLFGIRCDDGSAVAVLNERPDGRTIVADAHDVTADQIVIDARLRFAALGVEEQDNRLVLGCWFPGTEGGATYSGNTYPNGQLQRWRRRYHPIENGLTQHYQIAFHADRAPAFGAWMTAIWRWAWRTLDPLVVPQPIEKIERVLVDRLADQVIVNGDLAGIPFICDATDGRVISQHRKAIMGFCGRNVEAAYYLLHAAQHESDRSEQYRALAVKILDAFTRLPTTPPIAEGFDLDDGRPRATVGETVFLRSLSEGGAYMLRAWQLEQQRGVDHSHWRQWAVELGDWMIQQQVADGGFPRGWKLGSGTIEHESLKSSYNAVLFLLLLSDVTANPSYRDSAIRAAEFCWHEGQCDGTFVGGTVDNPDVVDKEAGTVSLEAYLALYEQTNDPIWLDRAQAAANFAETWIYCWNVPMAEDDDDAALHWKRGVSTVGLQLIASGHSLVDGYMAWDVARYAKLHRYTGDRHYLDVARILLHNTKLMIALPDRLYDLAGPGWQQEHWSLAPRRGYGLHRYWLPWMTVSHLEGIVSLREWDAGVYEELKEPRTGALWANQEPERQHFST
jgi:hypothetical protein